MKVPLKVCPGVALGIFKTAYGGVKMRKSCQTQNYRGGGDYTLGS